MPLGLLKQSDRFAQDSRLHYMVFLHQPDAADVIFSPLTTMGIAGGQETVGIAQIRPTACSVGTCSCGANTACRMLQQVCNSCSSSKSS